MSRNPTSEKPLTQSPQSFLERVQPDFQPGFLVKGGRSLERRLKTMESTWVPPGLTYLEMRSVRPQTIKDYQQRLDRFRKWLTLSSAHLTNLEDLDLCLVEFMNEMFSKGEGIDTGIRVHAAVRFFYPQLGRPSSGTLPRTVRALKGWAIAAPPRQRLPLPIEALGAIMGQMMKLNKAEMALRVFIQFLTYLRPGELSGLTVGQMVPPQGAMADRFRSWAILLHPVESGVPGKTGVFDATVLIDSDPWLHPILVSMISNRKPQDPLWRDSHPALVRTFSGITADLGLEHLGSCLYTLRHGGATHDIITRRRNMLEVKQRGRWQTDSSLRRYVKLARLQHEQSKIPKSIAEQGREVLANLPQLLQHALLKGGGPHGIQISQRGCKRKLPLSRNNNS